MGNDWNKTTYVLSTYSETLII